MLKEGQIDMGHEYEDKIFSYEHNDLIESRLQFSIIIVTAY